jgi:hypothetical protein
MSKNVELYKIVSDEESIMTKEEICMFLFGSSEKLYMESA